MDAIRIGEHEDHGRWVRLVGRGRSTGALSAASRSAVDRQWRWALAVVGPPGSGKGTQAERLCRGLGLTPLSTGDLARAAARERTERGRVIAECLNSGALLPDTVVFDLLRDATAKVPESSRGFLFDGFPRTLAQVVELEERLLDQPVDAYIELRVADDVLLERLAGRGREDDADLTVLRRLDEFARRTRPMIERLRVDGRVVSVDGTDAPAVVHSAITEALGRHVRRHNTLYCV
jgi:adenylate kinase